MSATPEPPRRRGEATRAVHLPTVPLPAEEAMALPVWRTAAWAFDSAETYGALLRGERAGYSYSRIDNPTSDAFAAAVAALEGVGVDGPVVGQPFASGMAAVATVLLTVLSGGDHVVAPRQVYGGTYGLLTHVLERFGVTTTWVDASDLDAVAAAIGPTTRVVWAETLANPTMTVADLPGLATRAHDGGALLVVDSTFASPAVCRPLEWGADLVVHSATKYLGGHADATGGVVVGPPDLVDQVRATRIDTGPMLAPDEAFLLHRGLLTLPLRVERHCASALALAEALADHPRLARVDYPGLTGHPDHLLARQLFDAGRFGAVVTVTPHGGRAAGVALCDGLSLVRVATSLGGVHSKVSHVASTTHRQLSDQALRDAGIDPGAVRISVGLEDVADLLDDVVSSLDRLPPA